MRARRDIQRAVGFLSTRFKAPDDDWAKLKQVLKYLNGIKHLELQLSTNDLGTIHWFVDASYAIHNDCKRNTGSMLTLGGGAITSFSRNRS